MEIRIETNIGGTPFNQAIRITGTMLSQLDEDLIREQVIREIKRAENSLMSMIVLAGVKELSKK